MKSQLDIFTDFCMELKDGVRDLNMSFPLFLGVSALEKYKKINDFFVAVDLV